MESENYRRWRLILGKDSEQQDSSQVPGQQNSAMETNLTGSQLRQRPLCPTDLTRDDLLDFLYQRETQGRGSRTGAELNHREEDWQDDDMLDPLTGGSAPPSIQPVEWLRGVRRVFPKSTVEIMQKQAIERYRMHGLLTDKEVLKQVTPNLAMVQTLLSFRSFLTPDVMLEVRRIIRAVCDELEARLAQKITSRFASKRVRQQHGGRRQFANLDWSASIRRNLKHYQPDAQQMVLERLYFYVRKRHQTPWEFIILVDQSASMAASVIHAAVMAAIFCQIRTLKTRLVLFDTEVVDITDHIHDPVETLLAVQLGGGTDIGKAMHYASTCISQASRSLLVLISDFGEGGDESLLYAEVGKLRECGVKMLGLAALDQETNPWYEERVARKLTDLGMPVAAMTPDHLAAWVASTVQY